MFDLGWMELIVIGIVALIVVGPKDLPMMFKTIGNFVGKTKRMAREFQSTMHAAAAESGLKETTEIIKKIDESRNPQTFLKKAKNEILNEDQEDFTDQSSKKTTNKEKKENLTATKNQ